eukprot:247733-Prymnesium_polylepis.1
MVGRSRPRVDSPPSLCCGSARLSLHHDVDHRINEARPRHATWQVVEVEHKAISASRHSHIDPKQLELEA